MGVHGRVDVPAESDWAKERLGCGTSTASENRDEIILILGIMAFGKFEF